MGTLVHHEATTLLASPVRRSLIAELERRGRGNPQEPGMTAAELAPMADLHVSTVRFHLDQLVHAGIVDATFQRQPTAGRPRKVYSYLGPPAAPPSSTPLMLLATLLAEAMTASVEGHPESPVEAGRRWSRRNLPSDPDRRPADTIGLWLARVGEVVDVLDQWGYNPEIATSDGGRAAEVWLSDCPFLDLARANEDVVCGVHYGLIAQALDQAGEREATVELEPFVGPSRCLAHIRSTTKFRTS